MAPSSLLFEEHVCVVSRLALGVAVVVIVGARFRHCFPADPHSRSSEAADTQKAWIAG
jgi:hypothetical protein